MTGSKPLTADGPAPDERYFSGEWLLDVDGFSYTRAYVGAFDSSWSGGVVFRASRAVLDDIADTQRKLREESPQWEWDDITVNYQTGIAVHTSPSDPDFRHEIRPDENGRYEIGFGWCWYEIDESDIQPETVVIRAYEGDE